MCILADRFLRNKFETKTFSPKAFDILKELSSLWDLSLDCNTKRDLVHEKRRQILSMCNTALKDSRSIFERFQNISSSEKVLIDRIRMSCSTTSALDLYLNLIVCVTSLDSLPKKDLPSSSNIQTAFNVIKQSYPLKERQIFETLQSKLSDLKQLSSFIHQCSIKEVEERTPAAKKEVVKAFLDKLHSIHMDMGEQGTLSLDRIATDYAIFCKNHPTKTSADFLQNVIDLAGSNEMDLFQSLKRSLRSIFAKFQENLFENQDLIKDQLLLQLLKLDLKYPQINTVLDEIKSACTPKSSLSFYESLIRLKQKYPFLFTETKNQPSFDCLKKSVDEMFKDDPNNKSLEKMQKAFQHDIQMVSETIHFLVTSRIVSVDKIRKYSLACKLESIRTIHRAYDDSLTFSQILHNYKKLEITYPEVEEINHLLEEISITRKKYAIKI